MYFSGNETFVVIVYRHYMKAINVLSIFITNTTESGSFVLNNMLAVMCDVLVLGLWIVAVWAITSPTFTTHKRTLLTPDGKTIIPLD